MCPQCRGSAAADRTRWRRRVRAEDRLPTRKRSWPPGDLPVSFVANGISPSDRVNQGVVGGNPANAVVPLGQQPEASILRIHSNRIGEGHQRVGCRSAVTGESGVGAISIIDVGVCGHHEREACLRVPLPDSVVVPAREEQALGDRVPLSGGGVVEGNLCPRSSGGLALLELHVPVPEKISTDNGAHLTIAHVANLVVVPVPNEEVIGSSPDRHVHGRVERAFNGEHGRIVGSRCSGSGNATDDSRIRSAGLHRVACASKRADRHHKGQEEGVHSSLQQFQRS